MINIWYPISWGFSFDKNHDKDTLGFTLNNWLVTTKLIAS